MKNKYKMLLGTLTANLMVCAGIPAISAHAADGLVTNADGTASYLVQGEAQTGRISVSPDYVVGDVEGDSAVTSADAAWVLITSATVGAGGPLAEELLCDELGCFADAADALRHADVSGDQYIDAHDAAAILAYAAQAGTTPDLLPLGHVVYCADANGILRTGWITDASGTCYAGEDFALLTGWRTLDGAGYYFDAQGCMQTGWQVLSGRTYYFGENGAMCTGMQEISGSRYYFGADGSMCTGWQEIGGSRYYFNTDGSMQTGWLEDGNKHYYLDAQGQILTGWQVIDGSTHYFQEDGRMLLGWQTLDGNRYYFNARGIMYTGLRVMADGTHYFSSEGVMQTGWQTLDSGRHYFDSDGRMVSGMQVIDGETYYFGTDGSMQSGWVETDAGSYYFSENGMMLTGFADLGSGMVYFEPDGRYYGRCYDITDEKTEILENAALTPHDSYIIYDRQVTPEKEYMTVKLSEKDIAILDDFANTHFTDGMTMAQKLWITQQWIHKKVDYAYAGSKWNSIVNLSYVEAIFVNRMGQCVQYNGAMAAMMIWFGYDVYMVKGWTDTGNQHFWTEVVIDGKTYLMECGNYGKNGNWHDFLTPLN